MIWTRGHKKRVIYLESELCNLGIKSQQSSHLHWHCMRRVIPMRLFITFTDDLYYCALSWQFCRERTFQNAMKLQADKHKKRKLKVILTAPQHQWSNGQLSVSKLLSEISRLAAEPISKKSSVTNRGKYITI